MHSVQRDVQTDFGPIRWTARPDVFGASGPLLLLIRGAFADPDSLAHLPDCVNVDCALANLPGQSAPPLAGVSVGLFAAAFRRSIEAVFPHRPLIVVGLSVGALVAMALRLPQVRRLILVDPPLSTGKLWPLIDRIREGWAQAAPAERDFCRQVFGVSDDTIEDRDYRSLPASIACPADVFFGGVALEPVRPLEMIPALTDEADQALFGQNPLVTRHLIPWAGHNIPAQAPSEFFAVVERACEALRRS